ncbi:MAG: nitroreductase [Nitrospira sp.]|nr:nitroreductase [bacterium]MBL7049474.1 nitroreductase [Nitrospira sp.]
MNQIIRSIKERRSVRAYKDKEIPKDLLTAVIEAGNEAPSGMNSQPWRFVVVESSELRNKMLAAALPNAKTLLEPLKSSNPERYQMIMKRYDELQDPIYYSAPAIIFVIGSGPYADMSCPLACQNMMLAAHSLGLGSCWVAFGSLITDSDDIKSVLELQDDEKIYGPILVGYPDGKTEAPPKKAAVVKWVKGGR